LQCVAVCCSVLQCVAVCCSVLQCVALPANAHAASSALIPVNKKKKFVSTKKGGQKRPLYMGHVTFE